MLKAGGSAQDRDWAVSHAGLMAPWVWTRRPRESTQSKGRHRTRSRQLGGLGAEQEEELGGVVGAHWGHWRYRGPKGVGCGWVRCPASRQVSGAVLRGTLTGAPVWGLGTHC